MNDKIRDVVERTIDEFCLLFYEHPYLEYNESGVHALFFHLLSENLFKNDIPLSSYYVYGDISEQVSLVQKEYRMFGKCDKTKAASWDVCALSVPLRSSIDITKENERKLPPYDYLEINSIVEFGLKANLQHLEDDIRRLTHNECRAIGKFIVHLERFSDHFSGRDYPFTSRQEFPTEDIMKNFTKDNDIKIYYVRTNKIDKSKQWVWKFYKGEMINLLKIFNK